MRKNSPRKWLHAILDLLPVILIPVFMIYSHRHTIDSYSVTRQERENQPYNFYQGVKNGKPNSSEHWLFEGGLLEYRNNEIYADGTRDDAELNLYTDIDIQFNLNDKLYLSFYGSADDLSSIYINLYGDEDFENVYSVVLDELSKYSTIITNNYANSSLNELNIISYDMYAYTFKNVQLFNLTEIFGSGNEPTQSEFESMLTQDYYNYGNNYVDNYVTISKTYNDTDIMSQFTYNLYNSVDKYFNMNNVFGMNNVYLWFESNIFHGTSPLYIYIVWNIVLYEFVMDLLMLLYSLFMWFIDICQNLIDRCYSSSKGGN